MIHETDVIGFEVWRWFRAPNKVHDLVAPQKIMVNPKRSELTCTFWMYSAWIQDRNVQNSPVFTGVFRPKACKKRQDQYLVIGLDHQWFLRNLHEGLAVSDTFPLKCNERWVSPPRRGMMIMKIQRIKVTTRETNDFICFLYHLWRFFEGGSCANPSFIQDEPVYSDMYWQLYIFPRFASNLSLNLTFQYSRLAERQIFQLHITKMVCLLQPTRQTWPWKLFVWFQRWPCVE